MTYIVSIGRLNRTLLYSPEILSHVLWNREDKPTAFDQDDQGV